MSHGVSSTLDVRAHARTPARPPALPPAHTHLQLELYHWPGKGWWPFLAALPRRQRDSLMTRLEQNEEESFEMQQLEGARRHDKNGKQQYYYYHLRSQAACWVIQEHSELATSRGRVQICFWSEKKASRGLNENILLVFFLRKHF